MVFDLRSHVTVTKSVIAGLDVAHCRHFLNLGAGTKAVDLLIDRPIIAETGQMPYGIQSESDWAATRTTLRDPVYLDRTKLWQFLAPEEAAPRFLGQINTGRMMMMFEGNHPPVRPAAPGQYGPDIFPLRAREGSVLRFDAGAFPGLPFGVIARKISDFGTPGARWAAFSLLDGTMLAGLVVPAAEGAGQQPNIVSGQNFSANALPPDGYTLTVIPPHSNTGTFNIKVDDMATTAARAATRPASEMRGGYLRSGVLTRVVWSTAQARWLLHRQTETISNANGSAKIFVTGAKLRAG